MTQIDAYAREIMGLGAGQGREREREREPANKYVQGNQALQRAILEGILGLRTVLPAIRTFEHRAKSKL